MSKHEASHKNNSVSHPADVWLRSEKLAVRFFWHRDRFAHEVLLMDNLHSNPPNPPWLFRSIESDSETPWPVSPPLQQVVLHEIPPTDLTAGSKVAALAVGMSGKGHWSASFELNQTTHTLVAEIACRSPIAPDRLRSEYHFNRQLLSEPNSAPAGESSRGTVARFSLEHGLASIELAGDFAWEVLPKESFALLAPTTANRFPATFLWRYSISYP